MSDAPFTTTEEAWKARFVGERRNTGCQRCGGVLVRAEGAEPIEVYHSAPGQAPRLLLRRIVVVCACGWEGSLPEGEV